MADSQAIGAAELDTAEADDGRLFCYRHPTSETWVRCNRCDRPICPKCAVQGPVGFRCRDCGLVKNHPLTTLSPMQMVLAGGIAIVGGAIVGIITSQVGFFSIIIAFFAGGLIVQAEHRVIGLKHGPVMLGIVIAGILTGSALGFAYEYATVLGPLLADPELGGSQLVQQELTFAVISAGAACAGAWSRLR